MEYQKFLDEWNRFYFHAKKGIVVKMDKIKRSFSSNSKAGITSLRLAFFRAGYNVKA